MSINRRMDKEDLINIQNGILLIHTKYEIIWFIATWMDRYRDACIFLNYSFVWIYAEELDHMATLILVFWRAFILFSIVTSPIYIPPTEHKGSLFSTSLPTFAICNLFDDGHSDRSEVTSHWNFGLHLVCIWFAFFWWLVVLSIFSNIYWPSVCFLWRNVYSGLMPQCFLSCMSCLYILNIKTLLIILFANVFSHSVHFVDNFPCCAKAFKFKWISFVYFCFGFLCLWRQVQKNIATLYVKECSAYVFF